MKKPQLRQHYPALDGVRALAVFAVLAYHHNFGWAKGGYLGVSLFFTLSGYLITSLILVEITQTGGLGYRAFAARRARRLLPAALLGVSGAVLFGATVATAAQQRQLSGDAWAALSYLANWHFILKDVGYADIFGAPSPLVHFWSLAIEGQFYILFPALAWLLVKLTRASVPLIAGLVGTLWIASLTANLILSDNDINRIYFGTDTRAVELLSGSVLAIVYYHFYSRYEKIPIDSPLATVIRSFIGVMALAALTYLAIDTELESTWLYRGGFAAISVVSALLIWSLLGTNPLSGLVGWQPFRWLGLRSYGLYLYHWPVYLWLTPLRTNLSPWPLFGLRVAVSVLLADLSFRYFETPLRRMSLEKVWKRTLTPVPFVLVGIGALAITQAAPAVLLHFDESKPVVPVARPIEPRMVVLGGDLASKLADDLVATLPLNDDLRIDDQSVGGCDAPDEITCNQLAWRWLQATKDATSVVLLIGPNDPWGQNPAQLGFLRSRLDPKVQVFWVTHPPVLGDVDTDLSLNGSPLLPVRLPANAVVELDYQRATITGMAERFGDPIIDLSRLVEPAPEGYPPERVVDAYPWGHPRLEEAISDVAKQLSTGLVVPSSTLRIMVVGDSIAQSLGWGFTDWAEETGEAFVWNVARPGCAIIREGELRDRGEMPDGCTRWATDFPAYINDFAPDLVVVHAGPWDSKRRRFSGMSEFVTPDDPYYMNLMRKDYTEVVEILSGGGAPVLWLNMPCVHPREVAEQAVFGPERRVPQRTVLNELDKQLAALHLYDLDALVCPGGVYQDQLGTVEQARPDGVHFSTEGARWVVDQMRPIIESVLTTKY